MRKLALLLLLAAGAHADTLSLGPERELVPRRKETARGLSFAGAATDGRDVLLAFTKLNVETREVISYAGLASGELHPLPTSEPALSVVWSGATYFVVTTSHLFPVSRDGHVGAPHALAIANGFRAAAASNGNGFLLATDQPRWRIFVRLFDRDGNPRVAFTEAGPPSFDASTRGNDYALFIARPTSPVDRVTIHADGTRESETLPSKLGRPFTVAAAHDAAAVHEIDPFSNTLFLAGREIDLGAGEAAPRLAWDGANYLVLTPRELRRYGADGTLRASAAGAYEKPLAIVTRPGNAPFVLWETNDRVLHASGGTLSLQGIAEQTAPAASSDGPTTIVAWREQNGIAATVFADPAAPHATIDVPGSTPTSNLNTISVAGVHFVVWRDETSVRMTRIGARGAVLDAQPVVVGPASKSWALPSSVNTPGLATDGHKALVAWCSDNKVWGAWLRPGERPEEPFVIETGGTGRYVAAAHAAFNGSDFVVAWTEEEQRIVADFAPPFGIYSSMVRGRAATLRQAIAPSVLPTAHMVVAPARAMWAEYRNPNALSGGDVSYLEVWTAPLTSDGAAAAKGRRIAMVAYGDAMQGAPAVDLAVYHEHALWSQPNALVSMPLDAEWKSTGEPVKLGEASNGSLRIVESRAGALLVYARRDGGVSRVFVRAISASPGTARTTPDTSARRDQR